MPIITLKNGGDIGEVFVSSVYDVSCMYVRMFVIRDGMLAGSYVCTYGVILGIRLTELRDVSQSGINGLENNIYVWSMQVIPVFMDWVTISPNSKQTQSVSASQADQTN